LLAAKDALWNCWQALRKLRDQGYDKKSIAQKTGLGEDYIYGILQLLKNGEERLLIAVEKDVFHSTLP
jgi:hypothetical protein